MMIKENSVDKVEQTKSIRKSLKYDSAVATMKPNTVECKLKR